jgi:hypothetical protein
MSHIEECDWSLLQQLFPMSSFMQQSDQPLGYPYTILMYPIPMANHTLWKTSTTTPLGPRTLPLAIAFKVTSNSTFVMG